MIFPQDSGSLANYSICCW